MTNPNDTIALQILLDGEDITSKVDLSAQPVTVTSAIDEELDTLDMLVQHDSGLELHGWQDVQVLDGEEVIFGGLTISDNQRGGRNAAKNDRQIGAVDYGAYLEKVYVSQLFTDKTDKEILAEIFVGSSDLAEYDGETCVVAVRTIPRVKFSRKPVRDVLNWLCEQSGGHWYVDYEKKLHYWGEVEYRAPYDVDSNPSAPGCETVEGVTVNRDAAGVVNIVEVVGGKAPGADKTFIYTPGTIAVELPLGKRIIPQDGEAKIAVRRNDGGATTNLIVNPSFETNISDGWTQYQAGSGGTWTQDTAKYAKGLKSLKIKAGTAVTVLQGQNITLNPGETLTVQARVWCATAAKAAVVIWDVGNSLNRGECYNRKANAWELVTTGYYNDTGAALTLRCELYNNANDSTTLAYYDAIQAEKLAWPSDYCDGSLGTGYAWTGTANNSTSTRVNMPIWTTLSVKTGNQDTLSARDEVLYFDGDGHLQQETFWPMVTNAVEVDGREEVPVRVVVRNYASYAFYGRWLKTVIDDSSIVDAKVARMRGATELAKNSLESVAIGYDVRQPGLRAGMTQNIHLPHRNLDGDYLIQRVTTTIMTGGQILSHVELGAADKSLVKLLLRLKRELPGGSDLTEDEILDNILDAVDSIEVVDGGATVVGSDGPYLWDVARWDYSKFSEE